MTLDEFGRVMMMDHFVAELEPGPGSYGMLASCLTLMTCSASLTA